MNKELLRKHQAKAAAQASSNDNLIHLQRKLIDIIENTQSERLRKADVGKQAPELVDFASVRENTRKFFTCFERHDTLFIFCNHFVHALCSEALGGEFQSKQGMIGEATGENEAKEIQVSPLEINMMTETVDCIVESWDTALHVLGQKAPTERGKARFSCGSRENLVLMRDDETVAVIAVTIGGFQDALTIIAPDFSIEKIIEKKSVQTAPVKRQSAAWRDHMAGVVQTSDLRIDMIIQKQEITLSALRTLGPGDVLKLGNNAIEKITGICNLADNPTTLFKGRLGRLGDHKAILIKHLDETTLHKSVAMIFEAAQNRA